MISKPKFDFGQVVINKPTGSSRALITTATTPRANSSTESTTSLHIL